MFRARSEGREGKIERGRTKMQKILSANEDSRISERCI